MCLHSTLAVVLWFSSGSVPRTRAGHLLLYRESTRTVVQYECGAILRCASPPPVFGSPCRAPASSCCSLARCRDASLGAEFEFLAPRAETMCPRPTAAPTPCATALPRDALVESREMRGMSQETPIGTLESRMLYPPSGPVYARPVRRIRLFDYSVLVFDSRLRSGIQYRTRCRARKRKETIERTSGTVEQIMSVQKLFYFKPSVPWSGRYTTEYEKQRRNVNEQRT